VRLWDPATGQHRAVLKGHAGAVNSLAFSEDSKMLASGGDQTVRLWDAATGQERAALHADTFLVFSVAFSPDGKTLASAGADRTVRLWEALPAGQPPARPDGR
jgi:WD40 repeat protein